VNPLGAAKHGNTVLITGAGGCIGSALAKRMIRSGTGLVILLDHSEQNLYEIHVDLTFAAGPPRHVPVLGDISDKSLLDELFEKYHPDTIFHAAAFKHVPLMEANPIAVIRNNVLGTFTLASAALEHGVGQLVMISTDKAANPCSVMGAAKRVAELIVLRFAGPRTRMSALRLVNVWGSGGSVVPLFQQQIQRGGPVTVAHPDSCRYFLSLPDTIDLILAAAALNDASAGDPGSRPEPGSGAVGTPGSPFETWGAIMAPDLAAPVKILDLAKDLIREAGPQAAKTEIAFVGLRPGDKLTEDLLSRAEWQAPTADARLKKINGPRPRPKQLDSAVEAISEGVRSRNLAALIETLCQLVPEYQPSAPLRAASTTLACRGAL
jgi:FlaA1/EpsC-like NDP-sugar epimerase